MTSYPYRMELHGKVVLITGASEGIGAACAQAFRKRGARLALTARNYTRLTEVGGADAFIVSADLLDPDSRKSVVEMTAAHYGTIDVLVNNAGIGMYSPIAEADLAQARALFDLNFFAPLELIQHVLPVMRKQKSGVIVNVSSIAGKIALPWFSLYSASKHALCALTDGMRTELKPYGIQAITVCPGYVNTGFQAHALAGKPPSALVRRRPLAITAEQCAQAIVRAVETDAKTVVTPGMGRLAIAAANLMPWLLAWQLDKMNRDGV